MKSKYKMYLALFLIVCSASMQAMLQFPGISEENKIAWHRILVKKAFRLLLETEVLPFEVIGSKKFVASELSERLDALTFLENNPLKVKLEPEDDALKIIAHCRSNMFLELKEYGEMMQSIFFNKCINAIGNDQRGADVFQSLLPFFKSLEGPIKKRIAGDNRTTEIEWRKQHYDWINPLTGKARDVQKCLELDIEEDLDVVEFRTSTELYRSYELIDHACAESVCASTLIES